MKMESLPDKFRQVSSDPQEPVDHDLERLIDLVERMGDAEEGPS